MDIHFISVKLISSFAVTTPRQSLKAFAFVFLFSFR